MKKRIACLLLALVMLIGVIPMGAVTASAASNKISSAGIKVIKEFVGFHKEAYKVGSEYRIGYGTPSVEGATITEAKADLYLREKLTDLDTKVSAAAPNAVQKQHDALVWYSYVYGTGLINSTGDMNIILNTTDKSTIVNTFCTWNYKVDFSGSDAQMSMMKTRMAMANLYINGVYSATDTGSFALTIFERGEGAFTKGTKRVQAFDTTQTAKIAVDAPAKSGSSFLGWYAGDSEKNYTLVTGLGSSTAGKTLVARFAAGSAETKCNYTLPASVIYEAVTIANGGTYVDQIGIMASASDSAKKINILKREDSVTVVGEVMVGDVKWLHLSIGGFVKLGKIGDVPTVTSGVNVAVTDDYVNVRKAPKVNGEKVGTLKRGEVVTIIMTAVDGNNNRWGYCSKGWICLMYTNWNEKSSAGSSASETVSATGTVSCGSFMNVRRNPSTTSTKVGTLANGTRVEIFEIQNMGGHKWGRISTGWICLDYVVLDAAPVVNTNSSVSGTAVSGVVANTDKVNVRKAAGVKNDLVTTLAEGTKVIVREQVTVDNAQWGKIDQGWVSLQYIKLDQSAASSTSTATVSASVSLAVRSGPGSEYQKVASLNPGTKVNILQKQTVKGVTWGKISQGWINLNFVSESASAQVNGIGGTVVNCSTGVNVRSAAGTTNALVGVAALGSRVVVTERTQVNGFYWGHIANGWVCMDYIKLDSEWNDSKPTDTTPAAPVATVSGYPAKMSADSGVHADASSDSKVLMTLKSGAKVTIQDRKLVGETVFGKVTVGTITGWVNMNDVALDTLEAKVSAAKADTYEEPSVRSKFFASLVKGTPVTVLEQKFDGTNIWGKIECEMNHTYHTCWIILSNVSMYPDNAAPAGMPVNNVIGTVTGTINASVAITKDNNGEYTTDATPYILVKGYRVSIQSRMKVGTSSFGKITFNGFTGWIDMSKVNLDPVEVTTNSEFKLYSDAALTTVAKTLKSGNRLTVLERTLGAYDTYGDGVLDIGKVYINDDAANTYYAILNEGRLTVTSKAPTESGSAVSVQSSVVVTGTVAAGAKIYEEAIAHADNKVLLELDSNAKVTILNWKNNNPNTWGKVQIGNVVGWVMVKDVTFDPLYGSADIQSLTVYGKADLGSTTEVLRTNGMEIKINTVSFDGKTLWGSITVGDKSGYINLADLKLNAATPDTSSKAILTGRINSVDKNVLLKQTPGGADGEVALPKNTSVKLIDVQMTSDGKAWFLVDMGSTEKNGWVEFAKLDLNSAIATVNAAHLYVVDDLETGSVIEYTLYRGEAITVSKFTVFSGALFGEVAVKDTTGWIMLCDSTNEKKAHLAPGSVSAPSVNNNSNTESAPSAPAETPAVQPQAAYIVCADTVRVRSGAGVDNPQIGTLKNGTVINVYEQVTVIGKGWARIDSGWVCMDYVKFGTTNTSGSSAATPTVITSVPAGAIAAGFANEDVKIRSGSGLGYEVVSTVKKNNALVIYEKKLDGGMSWGRTDNGWVCLSYLTITAIGSSGTNGTVGGAGFTVRVRNTAGINGAEMAKVMVSSRVAIYEQTTVSGESWGRTDLGWINMQYVSLDSTASFSSASGVEEG